MATGRFSRSENRTSASIAPSRATPGPARTTGAVAASSTSTARSTCASAGAGSTGTLTRSGAPVVSCSATSSGRTRNVAPGRSVRACLNALRTISGTASSTVIIPPHFVIGRKSWTRSTAWWDSLYRRCRPACAVIATNGCESRCAFAIPSIRLIAPGPERRQAHARAAGEGSVGVGHERGAALVPRGDEPDRGGGERIDHVEVLLPRQAEDVSDPLVLEALDEETCHGSCPLRVVSPSGRSGYPRGSAGSVRSAGGIPGRGAPSADGAALRPAAGPARRHRSRGRRGTSRPLGGLLAGARAPRARHPGDDRGVLGDDPRPRVRLGRGDRRARADRPDPPAPRSAPVPRPLRPARQDRLRDGRGGELAGAILGDRRGDGLHAHPAGGGGRGARRRGSSASRTASASSSIGSASPAISDRSGSSGWATARRTRSLRGRG